MNPEQPVCHICGKPLMIGDYIASQLSGVVPMVGILSYNVHLRCALAEMDKDIPEVLRQRPHPGDHPRG